jgi:hypothetical protein
MEIDPFLTGFSFFADFRKSAKSANLLFAESAKISKSAKMSTPSYTNKQHSNKQFSNKQYSKLQQKLPIVFHLQITKSRIWVEILAPNFANILE